ncbi:Nudix hydrolase family protein [Alloactinosynnema sp. L-07]|uniref:NUDIX hydrolase n=1 Tax=Alloactinosynnema sp. L-07 TaxID=1653480 RepID=UPI00065F0912|nr:NUDIX domain-containing protein [Alloactinosynnema sp. L-07]CRK55381.1 Nudix hydrolase family protein [Alloactinosynnema sp. L-07]
MSQSDYLLKPQTRPYYRNAVATSTVVVDDAGLLLMVRRPDSDSYHLPVGPPCSGETVSVAACRVAAESTGVDVEITGLVGIFDQPDDAFAVCFRGRPIGGTLAGCPGGEAVWVEPERLDELNVPIAVRQCIEHGLDAREPFFA